MPAQAFGSKHAPVAVFSKCASKCRSSFGFECAGTKKFFGSSDSEGGSEAYGGISVPTSDGDCAASDAANTFDCTVRYTKRI